MAAPTPPPSPTVTETLPANVVRPKAGTSGRPALRPRPVGADDPTGTPQRHRHTPSTPDAAV